MKLTADHPAPSRLPSPTPKTTFRDLLEQGRVIRLAGAHNPLGAKLAEQAGFDGIWSSGLEVSASLAVPDADILTMSELLDVAASIASKVAVPVVADCDAGYGGVGNVMNMVRQYEASGISALSIEDKPFPKKNSFADTSQRLVPEEEFCAKIVAANSARRTSDLVIIARIEALIVGETLEEALRRAHLYTEAGADAVLIHARGASPSPVVEFLRRWKRRSPVVVVPTTYHTITAEELYAEGADVVIYANHGLRAQVRAVSDTFQQILKDGRTTALEAQIAPVSEIFELQGLTELLDAESRYLAMGRTIVGEERELI